MGEAINKLCSDVDYKAVLGRITTIVYRPTDDKSKRLDAQIDGATLTFVDFIFGSTRDFGDYEDATTAALQNATVDGSPPPSEAPPPSTTTPSPAKRQPASSAWDGTYALVTSAGQAGICTRTGSFKTLVVARGKFSVPWLVDDWNRDSVSDSEVLVKVGRIDGVVHADGSVTATAWFGERVLSSPQVRTVKVKRQLDAITNVPFTFIRRTIAQRDSRLTKFATMNLDDLGGFFSNCVTEWAVPLPPLPQRPRGSGNPYPDSGPASPATRGEAPTATTAAPSTRAARWSGRVSRACRTSSSSAARRRSAQRARPATAGSRPAGSSSATWSCRRT